MIGPLYALIGLGAGFSAGLVGAGGGFLTVILLIAAGLPPHTAVGSSLVFVLAVAGWGALVHGRQGTGDPVLSASLGVPAAITATLGARLGHALPPEAISMGIVVLLLLAGGSLLRRRRTDTVSSRTSRPGSEGAVETHAYAYPAASVIPARRGASSTFSAATLPPASRWSLERSRSTPLGAVRYQVSLGWAIPGGAVVGLLQGIFGVGGGFMLVPFMISGMRIPEHVAFGASLLAILAGSLTGAVTHGLLGAVAWGAMAWLLPTGLVGSFLGAKLSGRTPAAVLRSVFLVLMAGSAVYLVIRQLG